MRKTIILLTAGLGILLSACTNEPLALQTGENAQTNKDGLVKVENSVLDISFAKPGTNWRHYHKIYFKAAKADGDHPEGYKAPRIDARIDGPNATYQLRPQDLDKLAAEFNVMATKVFDQEQPFELVTSAGPNTLVVETLITDIRLSAPREDTRRSSMQVRGNTYTQNSGSMVLLVQLKDGVTGELLAQSIDRGTTIDQWQKNTKVFNWADVRTVFRRWVTALKNAMMQVNAEQK